MPQHILCHTADIPDNSSKGFQIGEDNLFLVKHWGTITVFRNSCPHLGIALEWMPDQFLDADGQYIQCSTHGALFRIDNGECISGPCLGDALQAIPFSEDNGNIVVDLSLTTDKPQ